MDGMTVIRKRKLTQADVDAAEIKEMIERVTLRLKTAKPCPGCGRTEELEIIESDRDTWNDWYRVRCGWCDWCGPESLYPYRAVDEWNRREG